MKGVAAEAAALPPSGLSRDASQAKPAAANANPYKIEGPALISFSGGRTSGYMLWHILDAYDGDLPDNIHVTFANTGKEREETLRFVYECEREWGVRIRWLEWQRRERGEPWKKGFTETGYNSASRMGEPFKAMLRHKGYLPNAISRFCTIELKIRVMRNFAKSRGWTHWNSVVGLRADEMHRVFRALAANDGGKEPWTAVMPMASRAANVRQQDVNEWWAKQPFDLHLKPYEGNCDLCFLKKRSKLEAIIRAKPHLAKWWVEQEETIGASADSGNRFHMDRTFTDLIKQVAASPLLPLESGDDEEFDAECGLWCAGEAA